MGSVDLVEIWRGPFLESVHQGSAVICSADGRIVEAWGDPKRITLPRSSAKMIQALPLVRSGAADAFGLTPQQLALACASHQGAALHARSVQDWIGALGLTDDALRCGPQPPKDEAELKRLIKSDTSPCQRHNNCSGKHSGWLTLARHLGAGPDYIDIDHPVQIAVKEAIGETCEETSAGYGIDGCSAPNHAVSLHGLARAMAKFAAAPEDSAMERLRTAMATHPEYVAGETRACTNLMRAMGGRVAIKTGAEAVFVAIIPELKMGVALKIEDGSPRASEAAICAILVRLGVLQADHPETLKYLNAPIRNWRGIETGSIRANAVLG